MTEQANPVTLTCLSCGQGNRVPATRLGDGPKCAACGTALIVDQPMDISLAILEKAAKRDTLPLIVDFWAAWCGPCRMMAPEFAKAAAQMEGEARFAKLDTEAHPQTGGRYNIRGIPLLIAFQNGGEVRRQAGAVDAGQITAWARGPAHA